MIMGVLNKLINFDLLSLAEFGHFDTFPGWMVQNWDLKTNSAQLKLKLELSLAIAVSWCWAWHSSAQAFLDYFPLLNYLAVNIAQLDYDPPAILHFITRL